MRAFGGAKGDRKHAAGDRPRRIETSRCFRQGRIRRRNVGVREAAGDGGGEDFSKAGRAVQTAAAVPDGGDSVRKGGACGIRKGRRRHSCKQEDEKHSGPDSMTQSLPAYHFCAGRGISEGCGSDSDSFAEEVGALAHRLVMRAVNNRAQSVGEFLQFCAGSLWCCGSGNRDRRWSPARPEERRPRYRSGRLRGLARAGLWLLR